VALELHALEGHALEVHVNVLIAGCGYVGSALAELLVRGGHRVWGLRRDPRGLPDGVIPVAADLGSPASLDRAIGPAIDHLVYAASPGERTPAAYEQAYVRGLENVLAVIERRGGLERAVLTSSTAVYAQDDGGWIAEGSPTEPASFSGRTLLEAESLLYGRSFEGVALRLAGIYGPGRTWLVRRVHQGAQRSDGRPTPAAVRRGRDAVTERSDRYDRGEARVDPRVVRYGNRIHRDDCAGALAHLLTVGEPAPVYIGADDAPAPLAEVYAYVAELLGVAPPSEGSSDDEGRGGNKRCKNARLRASGYALRVPSYREGYPPIVRAYLREA